MIEAAIHRASKILPTAWPLQQLIAINPLWDMIESDLYTLSKTMHEQFGLQATLSLEQYHQYYNQGLIADADIKHAIHLLLSKKLSAKYNKDTPSSLENILYEFITDCTYQTQQSQYEKKINGIEKNPTLLLSQQISPFFYDNPLAWIKQQCQQWLAIFFDQGQAIWTLPTDYKNLFDAWYDLIQHQEKKWQQILHNKPKDIDLFIATLLNELQIPDNLISDYILEIVWQLKGWSGYIKWLEHCPNNPWTDKKSTIKDLIAMWLSYEHYFLKQHKSALKDFAAFVSKPTPLDSENDLVLLWNEYLAQKNIQNFSDVGIDFLLLRWIWQTAWEKKYNNELKSLILQRSNVKTETNLTPKAQWLFCIDTRSEGLRRHLEKTGNHETYGFAGFFGFVFQLEDESRQMISWQCPALLEPNILLKGIERIPTLLGNFYNNISKTKKHLLAPYTLFEMLGIESIFKLFGKMFLPSISKTISEKIKQKIFNKISIFKNKNDQPRFDIQQASHIAEAMLRTIGLISNFAEFVIICGHQATSENNPYQAALDCGACGGNAGCANAIVACEVFNHHEVRKLLLKSGIEIPETTHFIPACHNTTLDAIDCLENISLFSAQQLENWQSLQPSITKACEQLRNERLAMLHGNKNVKNRATHWAELIPEWGLANNAAMVIGPRNLTQTLNLKRRVFLHSYDPFIDPEGERLEVILTAPLIVAHWINMQYYFSTTDPHVYGSGNKAIHNLVSQMGVMQGNQSDLQIGLPQQSVLYQNQLAHTPKRLYAVVYANKTLVERIINKHNQLKNLINGQWIFIDIIEPTCTEL
jgi:uncharacterized protein YbcC (UPF0753/DUF2309 family)